MSKLAAICARLTGEAVTRSDSALPPQDGEETLLTRGSNGGGRVDSGPEMEINSLTLTTNQTYPEQVQSHSPARYVFTEPQLFGLVCLTWQKTLILMYPNYKCITKVYT